MFVCCAKQIAFCRPGSVLDRLTARAEKVDRIAHRAIVSWRGFLTLVFDDSDLTFMLDEVRWEATPVRTGSLITGRKGQSLPVKRVNCVK